MAQKWQVFFRPCTPGVHHGLKWFWGKFGENEMRSVATDKLNCIQKAREDFLLYGTIPAGVVNEAIIRSWQRSSKHGIGMERGETRCTSRSDLMCRRDLNKTLLDRSQPVMENLYHEICGTSSMVLLADKEGVILHSIGDPNFVDQAQKVYLKPGGIWSEAINGTNAIGTALEDKVSIHVHGSEHYIDKNRFLSCSATPIFDPRGAVLGALDVSGDYLGYQKHTMALVRLSAQIIENQMFVPEFPDDIVISFHLRPEYIGTLYEGIAVFSANGRFIAANRSALLQFGLDRFRMEGQTFNSLFKLSLAKLLDQIRCHPHHVLKLALMAGSEIFGRVWSGAAISPITNLPICPPMQEKAKPLTTSKSRGILLDELELGDTRMKGLIAKALKVVGHDIPIMIEGESGTGKELLAHALHNAGSRRHGPFIPINCASVPEGLIESELFGYQEGAFTGAKRKGHIGKIREADKGTLFLDEIGEMPLQLQARLLRVLQDRTVTPLGGTMSYQVDLSILCATNRKISAAVSAGSFREDLYYRLNGLLLTLPSLREREDKILLAQKILEELSNGDRIITLHPEVISVFKQHPWPGNIRQMHNILRTAVALADGKDLITLDELSDDFLEQVKADKKCVTNSLHEDANHKKDGLLTEIEAKHISAILERTNGNVAAAAKIMGIGRNTLYRKLKN
jgi:sigma-54 dependent transcriptional regulator, acetoin dehydrogenase operon transcriptional activator AcoR